MKTEKIKKIILIFMFFITLQSCEKSGFSVFRFNDSSSDQGSTLNHMSLQANPLTKLPTMGFGTYQAMYRSKFGIHWEINPTTGKYEQFGLRRQEILDVADAMIKNGMLEAGYKLILIESGFWYRDDEQGDRTVDGQVYPRKKLGDISSLVKTLHDRGFIVGTYTDTGTHGCGGLPGSGARMVKDLRQFMDWGFDYLKLDHCGRNPQTDANNIGRTKDLWGGSYQEYELWAKTISNLTLEYGRSFILNIADWEHRDRPAGWAYKIGNSWRTGYDVETYPDYKVSWSQLLRNFDYNDIPPAAGPGHWNDADSLMIGGYDLTDVEERSAMSMWSMQSAPLMLATYPLDLNADRPDAQRLRDIVLNKEIIALNQDPLGRQAEKVREDSFGRVVYSKILSGSGRRAVMLLNRLEAPASIQFYFSDLGLSAEGSYKVRDLWSHKDIGSFQGSLNVPNIPGHGSVVFLIEGEEVSVEQVSSFQKMGGKALGTPSIVTNANGNQTIFARGLDNHIWTRSRNIITGSSWSDWKHLQFPYYKNRFGEDEAFEFLEDVGVTADQNNIWLYGAGRADWAVQHERAVFFSYSTDGGATWSIPSILEGDIRGRVAPALRDYSTFDILGKGVDGSLWRKTWHYENGKPYWDSWSNLGGCVRSGVSTLSRGNGRIDFTYIDCQNKLVHGYYLTDGKVQVSQIANSELVTGSPAIVMDPTAQQLNIFVKKMNQSKILRYVYRSGTTWENTSQITVCAKSGVNVFQRPSAVLSRSNGLGLDLVINGCNQPALDANQDEIADSVLLKSF